MFFAGEDGWSDDETSVFHSTNKRKIGNMVEFQSGGRVKREFFSPTAVASGSGKRLWWDECDGSDCPEDIFRKEFRMTKSTFELICSELGSVTEDDEVSSIPVRKRVAVCIRRLATAEPFLLVSKRFGLSIPACRESVIAVCSAMRNALMPRYLRWPDKISLRNTKQEFEATSGIPNVVGSMSTTHISTTPLSPSLAAYFNKKQTKHNGKPSYTVTLQAVVDHNGLFTDVCIGWPGSMSAVQVLHKSALFERANGGLLNGVWVAGSKGHPLMDWVLVPYNRRRLTWTEHGFNEKIGEIQRVANEAFMRLKGRWFCLQKNSDFKLQDLAIVVGACCVLHNICEMRGDGFDSDLWGFEFAVDDEEDEDEEDEEMAGEVDSRSVSSMEARDAIAHNLLHHACY